MGISIIRRLRNDDTISCLLTCCFLPFVFSNCNIFDVHAFPDYYKKIGITDIKIRTTGENLMKPVLRQTNAITYCGTEEYEFSFNDRKFWIECNKCKCGSQIVNNVLLRTDISIKRLCEEILNRFDDIFVDDLKQLSCRKSIQVWLFQLE